MVADGFESVSNQPRILPNSANGRHERGKSLTKFVGCECGLRWRDVVFDFADPRLPEFTAFRRTYQFADGFELSLLCPTPQ